MMRVEESVVVDDVIVDMVDGVGHFDENETAEHFQQT